MIYLTAGLSFGSIDLEWRSWSIADLTQQLVSDLGDAEAINLLGQYLGRNSGEDLPDAGVAGSGIDAVSLDWVAIQDYLDTPVEERDDASAFLADAEIQDELWIALSQSYAPNQLFNNSVGVMSLIDRDTDQVLARFMSVRTPLVVTTLMNRMFPPTG